MATTKLYLDLRGKAQDGKGSVVITLAHNGTTATFPTGVRVSPQHWNGSSVVKSPESEVLNAILIKKKSDVDKALAIMALEDDFSNRTATQLKSEVSKNPSRKLQKHLVSEVFEEYMSMDMRHGTRELYKYTLKKVLACGGDGVTMDKIDYKWLLQFERFLVSGGQSTNGRSVYLRCLRAICNYAVNTGIKADYPFRFFTIKSEPTRKKSIVVDTLRNLYRIETTPSKQMYKDYFFLMLFLIGINMKDLLLAKKFQFDGTRLEYIRSKTNKKYSIKVEPEAFALIEKHSGKGEYLMDALDHCKFYENFMHQMNDALKTIGVTVSEEVPDPYDLFAAPHIEEKFNPVVPDISTNYSRHTWATLAYEIGIPIDLISQALGHSFGNKTTLIYVKKDQSKVDEANRKVIDYFLGVE